MNQRSNKKLWIVSELFFPDETSTAYILTKIANQLTIKYDVNVICGPSVYDKEKEINNSNAKLSNKINIIRKKSSGNKNFLVSRFFSSILLSIRLFNELYKKVNKEDTVFIVTNPPMLMNLISWIKRRKKFRLIILVHDVFPENTIPAGIIKSPKNILYKIAKNIFDKSYSKADKLIVLGSDMKDIISQKIHKYRKDIKIEIIQNWAETDIIYPLNLEKTRQKIEILFAGNLGRVQGLQQLFSIIPYINNSSINFHFAGTGAMKEEMKAIVEKLNLTNVSFQNAFPRKDQIFILNNSDICLVTLVNEMYGLGVPSKTYNIMAAGKPILFIGNVNSEIAKMIYKYDIGFVFSFDNKEFIIDFLNNTKFDNLVEKGARAREVAEKYFSEKIILNKFIEAI